MPKKVQPVTDVAFPSSLSLAMCGHQGLGWRHPPWITQGTQLCRRVSWGGAFGSFPQAWDGRAAGSWPPLHIRRGWEPEADISARVICNSPMCLGTRELPLLCSHEEGSALPAVAAHWGCVLSSCLATARLVPHL